MKASKVGALKKMNGVFSEIIATSGKKKLAGKDKSEEKSEEKSEKSEDCEAEENSKKKTK